MTNNNKILVSVIMGSNSDWDTMAHASELLESLNIPCETKIISAHRTPERMFEFAKNAKKNGIEVIIAGAGGAAHLPGMVASLTELPVLGVPVKSKALKGMDSLLSIVQMPAGVPVATFAIGKAGARNAAIFAAHILGLKYPEIAKALTEYRQTQTAKVAKQPK